MNLNYKVIDTAKIVDYISLFESSVCVADIIQNSGADKLRVKRKLNKRQVTAVTLF